MHTRPVDARQHRPDGYRDDNRDFIEGYRAIQLIDDQGSMRGELVWRLAAGHTAEITELNIFESEDRRRGHGTTLLEAAIVDMREYFARIGHEFRRIYLFTGSRNTPARSFYEPRGFRSTAELEDFFYWDDAIMYVYSIQRSDGT